MSSLKQRWWWRYLSSSLKAYCVRKSSNFVGWDGMAWDRGGGWNGTNLGGCSEGLDAFIFFVQKWTKPLRVWDIISWDRMGGDGGKEWEDIGNPLPASRLGLKNKRFLISTFFSLVVGKRTFALQDPLSAPALSVVPRNRRHLYFPQTRKNIYSQVSDRYMDAAAELGRNPVSKHQIQPEYADEKTDAGRDCWTRLARPISQARTRTGKYYFSPFSWPRTGLATLPGWSILLLYVVVVVIHTLEGQKEKRSINGYPQFIDSCVQL